MKKYRMILETEEQGDVIGYYDAINEAVGEAKDYANRMCRNDQKRYIQENAKFYISHYENQNDIVESVYFKEFLI